MLLHEFRTLVNEARSPEQLASVVYAWLHSEPVIDREPVWQMINATKEKVERAFHRSNKKDLDEKDRVKIYNRRLAVKLWDEAAADAVKAYIEAHGSKKNLEDGNRALYKAVAIKLEADHADDMQEGRFRIRPRGRPSPKIEIIKGKKTRKKPPVYVNPLKASGIEYDWHSLTKLKLPELKKIADRYGVKYDPEVSPVKLRTMIVDTQKEAIGKPTDFAARHSGFGAPPETPRNFTKRVPQGAHAQTKFPNKFTVHYRVDPKSGNIDKTKRPLVTNPAYVQTVEIDPETGWFKTDSATGTIPSLPVFDDGGNVQTRYVQTVDPITGAKKSVKVFKRAGAAARTLKRISRLDIVERLNKFVDYAFSPDFIRRGHLATWSTLERRWKEGKYNRDQAMGEWLRYMQIARQAYKQDFGTDIVSADQASIFLSKAAKIAELRHVRRMKEGHYRDRKTYTARLARKIFDDSWLRKKASMGEARLPGILSILYEDRTPTVDEGLLDRVKQYRDKPDTLWRDADRLLKSRRKKGGISGRIADYVRAQHKAHVASRANIKAVSQWNQSNRAEDIARDADTSAQRLEDGELRRNRRDRKRIGGFKGYVEKAKKSGKEISPVARALMRRRGIKLDQLRRTGDWIKGEVANRRKDAQTKHGEADAKRTAASKYHRWSQAALNAEAAKGKADGTLL